MAHEQATPKDGWPHPPEPRFVDAAGGSIALSEAEQEEAQDMLDGLEAQSDPYALSRVIEHFIHKYRRVVD